MKSFISDILGILNRAEKAKAVTLTAFDVLVCALDIVFLGGLLLLINYYANGNTNKHFFFIYLNNDHSLLFISIFLVLYGVKNWLGYKVASSENAFFYDVASRLSRQNIMQYLKGDYTSFVNTDSSVQIRRISQQPIEFSNYILTNIQQIITQSILIAFTITAILFYHPLLFLALFVLLVPPVFVVAMFIKSRLGKVRANIKVTGEKTLQHLNESLAGFVESNLYDKDQFFTGRYVQYQQQLNENIATQQSLQVLPARLIEIFAILGLFLLVLISKVALNAQVDWLNIGVFMAAAYKIIPGIVKILNSAGQVKTYQFVIDDIKHTKVAARNLATTGQISSIEFKNVGFTYNRHKLINDFSLELLPGDLAGISADSGRGKTTIVNLLLGFLESTSGDIHINYQAADSRQRKAYFNKISYVKQQSFFINDSILKNVILTDGDHDADRHNRAINFSGIGLLADSYPEGIQKVITENGKNISGGQRQRIMLARALYHDFDLLILDEPFSELDEEAEHSLLSKLRQFAGSGKIILLITHNKASLDYCNKIISPDKVYEA